ncbi:hypothetical protein L0Y97_07835 [Burkholderia multivorans]|uniref:hypothetical protein n=1 Tax=Burkholderia multivorans TaxID=87883 RepID=UPI00201874D9|nr:hypothetical protein [Burkholderia multivorans]MCO1358820.1 hypothetical protein [Burkholderia multivorans]MCO1418648.1 hypothetical protein [Burkholderia multivorans]UQO98133.1 hypothetical protein L0Z41_20980 [Burkholderia multivorans]
MPKLQKINLGTPPRGEDGESTRIGFMKMNGNVDVLASQLPLLSADLITRPQTLTTGHVGTRVNISLNADGAIGMPPASSCLPDQVILVRNVGTTKVTLTASAGSGDAVGLSTLNPGDSALMDTDGVHGWNAMMRGRASGNDETVIGKLTVGGGGAFGERPTFGKETPWDTGNLSPFKAGVAGDGMYFRDPATGWMVQGFLYSGAPVGNYNQQTIGGQPWYTHYYKVGLPNSYPQGVFGATANLVGGTFNGQTAEIPAFLRVRRDIEDGSVKSKDFVTVALTTPVTGWGPFIHVWVWGK